MALIARFRIEHAMVKAIIVCMAWFWRDNPDAFMIIEIKTWGRNIRIHGPVKQDLACKREAIDGIPRSCAKADPCLGAV